MPSPIDLTGKRYGRLVAVAPAAASGRLRKWDCQCDCGSAACVATNKLTSGHTRSCGCLVSEALAQTTHGMRHTRVYSIWKDMRKRCQNPKATHFENYGGRGIRVCAEWEDFHAFYADMGEPPSGAHTLDRMDSNGNYEKGNCRWATMKEQSRNRRNNHMITHDGRTLCLSEWAELRGMSERGLWQRLRRGWPLEKALAQPMRRTP